jgi:hypothetical protein
MGWDYRENKTSARWSSHEMRREGGGGGEREEGKRKNTLK